MHSHFVSGERTGIQPRYQKGTDKGTFPGRQIHLGPLSSDFPVFDRGRERTPVIGHIDQEIRDPSRFKLLDRSLNIKWELGKCSLERANKHLAPR